MTTMPQSFPAPKQPGEKAPWPPLPIANACFTWVQLVEQQTVPLCVITKDSHSAEQIKASCEFFKSPIMPYPIEIFPDWEILPYDRFSPHQDIVSQRLSMLARLPFAKQGIFIFAISTLLHRLPPTQFVQGNAFNLKKGDSIDIDIFRQQLEAQGYCNVSTVISHGEFAVRGGILDIFPMGSPMPFRVELLDNEVDTIRLFNPEDQLSSAPQTHITLLPAHEFPLDKTGIQHFRQQFRASFEGNPLKCPLYETISAGHPAPGSEYYLPLFFDETHTIFDYLPADALLVRYGDIHGAANRFWETVSGRYESRRYDIEHPILPPEAILLPVNQWFEGCGHWPQIKAPEGELSATKTAASDFPFMPPANLFVSHQKKFPLATLKNYLDTQPGRFLFCTESAGRQQVLLNLLKTIEIHPQQVDSWHAFREQGSPFGITVGSLLEGLVLKDPTLHIITESQLFPEWVPQRRRQKKSGIDPDKIIQDLTELHVGDPVVHLTYGVGRYQGLTRLNINDTQGEFLLLTYANDDKIYVPITSLNLINRYTGIDPEKAPLHKLGSDQWEKAKKKAEQSIRDVAAELLNLHAKRALEKGIVFDYPGSDYLSFANGFPFEATPDQASAIEAVIEDMKAPQKMDRLVCGDVGFGKTEVALRAAFIAAFNQKQVAILVPTTLLADQHFQTFQDRFADFPINIARLSRFQTPKAQKETLHALEAGKVDIVIGTHKLLQRTIQFKRLGLLIVDEEHRFGVRQKEQLKALKANVDLITLTATPIPRTLNMAMAKLRDISIIATPPPKRLSVKTFVQPWDDASIKEAISREIQRGGQVFFLHNEVRSIDAMADRLRVLLPDVSFLVAHGQMPERQLEQIMMHFYHHRFQVLICTTIIENGIDIPTANTLIINGADHFGLAQLHQLRGRVGRSHHQAYAYLIAPPKKFITKDAAKRLTAITQLDELGAGFTLATHDLEIRGAGEILGDAQSGHIEAVGFSLYQTLLQEAIATLKKEGKGAALSFEPTSTEIDLTMPALIPETYIQDIHTRLIFYKRLANSEGEKALETLQVELIDRFGLLPEPLQHLFEITHLQQKAKKIGISKLVLRGQRGNVVFTPKPTIPPENIIMLIQKNPTVFRLSGADQLSFKWTAKNPADKLAFANTLMEALEKPRVLQ